MPWDVCVISKRAQEHALSPTCIGNLWVFENLQAKELEALTNAAQRKLYKKGQEVFSQGQTAKKMFLLKGGRVKLSKLAESGDEITLDIRKAGDFLGEAMLAEDMVYPLTATCLEDTLICGFDKPGLEKLILDHPNIGLQVIKNLSRRIDWLTSRVGSFSLSNLEERLYQVLSQVAREHCIQEGQRI